ncbi:MULTISPECIES: hypothetical protein [Pseudomonas]|uniref:Uncharacterized protein n=1 Tax=Pseudomonas cichorii TaxID=36746 RepID=A0A3M4VE00_PSECI|nr:MULTISPECIES: hypothetical protein [Pseudomonas]AHF68790.1 hypothetical protein PCH70_36370 [Pseudomonas cichorii JBC1]QVE15786.1 hypothetical protein KGD89_18090 [Pseudomonas cichorii]RMR49867.1 hypothetical protein ALP84_01251 [Pseudomonas cichorii]SDN30177.1 hypothetical protein SAMN05216599_101550 [Pseudomonas cichorii]GFM75820.1 hypothetical protein PSCICM_16390 [Pseudomonas cichorii]
MNITLTVQQHLSYREALKIAYDEAKQDGTLDEITEAACQKEFNSPLPAAIYHESSMVSSNRVSDTGGTYFKCWTLRDSYEQAKINARVYAAESLSNSINNAVEGIKEKLKASGAAFNEQDLKFSINEKGEFKPVSASEKPNEEQESIFTKLLNESEDLRKMAREYVRMVFSLVDFTVEGWDAPYARYLVPEEAGS